MPLFHRSTIAPIGLHGGLRRGFQGKPTSLEALTGALPINAYFTPLPSRMAA